MLKEEYFIIILNYKTTTLLQFKVNLLKIYQTDALFIVVVVKIFVVKDTYYLSVKIINFFLKENIL